MSPFGPPSCTDRSFVCAWALEGSWQLAQDCLPDAERLWSLKINSPSAATWLSELPSAGAVRAVGAPEPPPQAMRAKAVASASNLPAGRHRKGNIFFIVFWNVAALFAAGLVNFLNENDCNLRFMLRASLSAIYLVRKQHMASEKGFPVLPGTVLQRKYSLISAARHRLSVVQRQVAQAVANPATPANTCIYLMRHLQCVH